MTVLIPTVLAHHEGATANPASVTQDSVNDMALLWIIGGIILGSLVIIILIHFFSSKSHRR